MSETTVETTKEKTKQSNEDFLTKEITLKLKKSPTFIPILFPGSKRTLIAYPKPGGGFYNGLSPRDIETLMPQILGIKYDESNFWSKYQDFWVNFRVVLSDRPQTYDITTPYGQVTYKFLLNHKYIAESKDAIGTKPESIWYIEDKKKEARFESKKISYIMKAYAYLAKMSRDDKKDFFRLIDLVGLNPESMIEEQLDVHFHNFIKNNAELFVETYEDSDKSTKMTIQKLIFKKIIQKKKDRYYYGDPIEDVFLGNSIEDLVEYIDNPKNNSTKESMIKQLSSK